MMNETFTASNGVEVVTANGHLQCDGWVAAVGSPAYEALTEFFLHQAGLWVDPVTGSLVIRRKNADDSDGRAIAVIMNGVMHFVWDHCDNRADLQEIKERYFEAHPERKPWHDAKPGEVWAFTLRDAKNEIVAMIDPTIPGGSARTDYLHSPDIISGRRIWPESK
jgi:hypothetical protein